MHASADDGFAVLLPSPHRPMWSTGAAVDMHVYTVGAAVRLKSEQGAVRGWEQTRRRASNTARSAKVMPPVIDNQ